MKYLTHRNNIIYRYLNDDDLIKICDAMKKYGIDKLKELE